ncbi:hypothetical protein MPSEU_000322100 [Mayamaea pseudoterrestris]|nr:hypothetical protein MPSEU_000322100 [Mayamaea pseudoterrestris]
MAPTSMKSLEQFIDEYRLPVRSLLRLSDAKFLHWLEKLERKDGYNAVQRAAVVYDWRSRKNLTQAISPTSLKAVSENLTQAISPTSLKEVSDLMLVSLDDLTELSEVEFEDVLRLFNPTIFVRATLILEWGKLKNASVQETDAEGSSVGLQSGSGVASKRSHDQVEKTFAAQASVDSAPTLAGHVNTKGKKVQASTLGSILDSSQYKFESFPSQALGNKRAIDTSYNVVEAASSDSSSASSAKPAAKDPYYEVIDLTDEVERPKIKQEIDHDSVLEGPPDVPSSTALEEIVNDAVSEAVQQRIGMGLAELHSRGLAAASRIHVALFAGYGSVTTFSFTTNLRALIVSGDIRKVSPGYLGLAHIGQGSRFYVPTPMSNKQALRRIQDAISTVGAGTKAHEILNILSDGRVYSLQELLAALGLTSSTTFSFSKAKSVLRRCQLLDVRGEDFQLANIMFPEGRPDDMVIQRVVQL